MLLRNRAEDAVPVRPAEVGRRAQRGDRVALRTDVLHDDVRHVVLLDLRGEVDVDLDAALAVLLLDRLQQRVEPLGGAEVADDPREVDLRARAR